MSEPRTDTGETVGDARPLAGGKPAGVAGVVAQPAGSAAAQSRHSRDLELFGAQALAASP
jgi:hypothetical protein